MRTQWICLTGFMGAGKSTVGACLAHLLSWSFLDLDLEIVKREGRSIGAIFSSVGEQKFRQMEAELLRSVLREQSGPAVMALGGGTFAQAGNRDLLCSHGAATVYLEGDFDLLRERCCLENGTRPLMQDPVAFRALFEKRLPIYALADFTQPIAGRSPNEIAAQIRQRFFPQGPHKAVSE